MSRNESGQLEPGSLLAGRYRVERFLAGGGMGVVYIGTDQRLAERQCAIKEIFDRFTTPEERAQAIEYFHREADTLSQLNHPAIPAIFDRFGEGNCHYLVMDFIEGRNLEEVLVEQDGPLPESRVVEIARELCDVLSYLHSFDPPVIYRDMKPGNVIVKPDGHVALIDFGIARIFSPQGKATLIGTPGFAPPEQYAGKVDQRSDIYSLAASLHYMVTGRDPEKHPPFSCPPVLSEKPDVSPFLAQAVDKALAYKIEERPFSAEEFKEMFLYGRGLSATAPSSSAKAATQPLEPLEEVAEAAAEAEVFAPAPNLRRKRRWTRRIAALLFIGLLASSAYGLYTNPEVLPAAFEGNAMERVGEQIPWQKIEAWLPEPGQVWLREFVADLPWEREKRLRALRADPVELVSLTIFNTSRDGTPVTEPQEKYSVGQVKYLTWEVVLKNRLAGIEGINYQLEGRFFDPEGGLAGKSKAGRYVRPEEEQLEFRGITLLEGLKERAKGDYQLDVYLGDTKLADQKLLIEAEPTLVAKKDTPSAKETRIATAPPVLPGPSATAIAAAEAERKRRAGDAKRVALIQERSKKPLEIVRVRFINTAKNGKRLSEPSKSFAASKIRFMAWEAEFKNRLHSLTPAYHRVEATYYAPNGQPLGTVQDGKEVKVNSKRTTFTGRIGNASGGAFIPGKYRVDFYVNGWPLSSEEFIVQDDRKGIQVADRDEQPWSGLAEGRPGRQASTPERPSIGPALRHHTGSLLGLVSGREVPLEITFRPQRNGSLRGRLIIHEPGYGVAPLEGQVQGSQIEFRSPLGRDTYYFKGWQEGDRLTGTYQVSPTRKDGRWSVRISERPAS